jgi:DNA polymerase III delta prime subunit
MSEDFLWVEKYRPKTISECILPAELKTTFQQFVEQENIPNMILAGSAGVGKTTVAKAMLEQLDCDYIIINGSLNGNIDTLRNDIQNFASSVSLSGGRKYVILDEADYLNANSTQPALRNFMEEFSKNCGFILTCNFRNRIIEPLHSRCSIIEFKFPKEDAPKLAAQFFKRMTAILEKEGIAFDKAAVAGVIQRYYPDYRRVINELQRHSSSGEITSHILGYVRDTPIFDLIPLMRAKEFTAIRKWVSENNDIDQITLFRAIFDGLQTKDANSEVQKVLLLAKYQYQAAFAADAEINILACIAELMVECDIVTV